MIDATAAGPSLDSILALMREREEALGDHLRAMRETAMLHDDQIVVPMPDMNAAQKPYFANLIAQAVDQGGMRIGSVRPALKVPSINPGHDRADRNAALARKALLGMWSENGMERKLRRRARQLQAYACTPVVVLPDNKRVARWEVRHAMTALPDPFADPDSLVPDSTIFTFVRSARWVRDHYPGLRLTPDRGGAYRMLEYIDAEVRVMAVLGNADGPSWMNDGAVRAEEVVRLPNRANLPLAVVPGRISLNAPRGQFDGTLGIFQALTRMMNTAFDATDKGIWPDMALIGRPGEIPKLLTGDQWKDGRTGEINVVSGGDVKTLDLNPGYMTNPMIDRLERALRLQGLMPAQWGGEGATGLRTGRANEVVEGSAIDQMIAEAQNLLAASLEEENRIAVATAKAYDPDRPRSLYVRWDNAQGAAAFVPSKVFATDICEVSYAIPGADVNAATVNLAQMAAAELMSKRTVRERHPWIQDADFEENQLTIEGIRRAQVAALEQGAATGQMPAVYLARIEELLDQGKKLNEAIKIADQEARVTQASSGPPGTPEGPVPAGSPEAQLGLAAGPAGAAAPVIPEASEGQMNLTELLRAVRTSSQIARTA